MSTHKYKNKNQLDTEDEKEETDQSSSKKSEKDKNSDGLNNSDRNINAEGSNNAKVLDDSKTKNDSQIAKAKPTMILTNVSAGATINHSEVNHVDVNQAHVNDMNLANTNMVARILQGESNRLLMNTVVRNQLNNVLVDVVTGLATENLLASEIKVGATRPVSSLLATFDFKIPPYLNDINIIKTNDRIPSFFTLASQFRSSYNSLNFESIAPSVIETARRSMPCIAESLDLFMNGTAAVKIVPNMATPLFRQLNDGMQDSDTPILLTVGFLGFYNPIMSRLEYLMLRLSNVFAILANPITILETPSDKRITHFTGFQSTMSSASLLTNRKIYVNDHPNPLYGILVHQNADFVKDVMSKLTYRGDYNVSFTPIAAEMPSVKYNVIRDGVKLRQLTRLSIDQFAAAIYNNNLMMVTDNPMLSGDVERIYNTCISYASRCFVDPDPFDRFRLEMKPSLDNYKMAILLQVLNPDAILNFHNLCKVIFKDRNLISGMDASILNETSVFTQNGLSSILGIFQAGNELSDDQVLDFLIYEFMADFYDIEISFSVALIQDYEFFRIVQVLCFFVLFPKIAWQSVHILYTEFKRAIMYMYAKQYNMFIQMYGEYRKFDGDKLIPYSMTVNAYTQEVRADNVLPTIFVLQPNQYQATSRGSRLREFRDILDVFRQIGEMIQPKYQPVDLSAKRAAGFPFIGNNYTGYLSHKVSEDIRNVKAVSNISISITTIVQSVLRILRSHEKMTLGTRRPESFNISSAIQLYFKFAEYVDLLFSNVVWPQFRSLMNSLMYCLDRTDARHYYAFRPRLGLMDGKVLSSAKPDEAAGSLKYVYDFSIMRVPPITRTVGFSVVESVIFYFSSTLMVRPILAYNMDPGKMLTELNNISIPEQNYQAVYDMTMQLITHSRTIGLAQYLFRELVVSESTEDDDGLLLAREFLKQFNTAGNANAIASFIKTYFGFSIYSLFVNRAGVNVDFRIGDPVLVEIDYYGQVFIPRFRGFEFFGDTLTLISNYQLRNIKTATKIGLDDNSPLYHRGVGIYITRKFSDRYTYSAPPTFEHLTEYVYSNDSGTGPHTAYYGGSYGVNLTLPSALSFVYKLITVNSEGVRTESRYTDPFQVPKHILRFHNVGLIFNNGDFKNFLNIMIHNSIVILTFPELMFNYQIDMVDAYDKVILDDTVKDLILDSVFGNDITNAIYNFVFQDTSQIWHTDYALPVPGGITKFIHPMHPLVYQHVSGGIYQMSKSNGNDAVSLYSPHLIPISRNNFSPGLIFNHDDLFDDRLCESTVVRKLDSDVVNFSNRVATVGLDRQFGKYCIRMENSESL